MQVDDHAPVSRYVPSDSRYQAMPYRNCGRSGVKLPVFSLGLWHNFGERDNFSMGRQTARTAFDLGISHFDLANNYGPPYGAAEETFGRILDKDLRPFRDELIVATKAGYDMWPGPYGRGGSRKYLTASLDQSLQRMGLDYVDIFYHHCPDPETPVEETVAALDSIVRQGKALYVGVSNYSAEQMSEALPLFKSMGVPCLIHQGMYSMFQREAENGLIDICSESGVGIIAFSPLAQGLLTGKYLKGIPDGSRASDPLSYLGRERVAALLPQIKRLAAIAEERGQSLAQMALSWLLRTGKVSSVLLGASSPEQLKENVAAKDRLEFSEGELARIERVLKD